MYKNRLQTRYDNPRREPNFLVLPHQCPAQRKAKILKMRKEQINNLIPRGQLVSIKNEHHWEKWKKPALVTAVTFLHLPTFFSKLCDFLSSQNLNHRRKVAEDFQRLLKIAKHLQTTSKDYQRFSDNLRKVSCHTI